MDTSAPTVTLAYPAQRIAAVLRRGLRVTVRASETATGTVRVALPANNRTPFGVTRWHAQHGTRLTLTVKPTRAARALLHHARRSVTLILTTTAHDSAGNAAKPLVRHVVLRR